VSSKTGCAACCAIAQRETGTTEPTSRLRNLALLLALLTGLLAGCRGETPVYTTRFLAFGTLMDISIVGVRRDDAERASQLVEQDFAFMHRAWHAWDPGPMGRVNQLLGQGKPFAAPPSVLPLLRKSQELAEQSGNLFNPAIGRLIDLWGFHTDSPECRPPPPAREIRALVKANPRMSDIQVDGIMLRCTNPRAKLDFGAIGKGYGIDLAIGHLRELGIHNVIINAGGDLRAIGDRDGQPWRIAIRRPTGGVFAILKVSGDESVFTSGDYERNFVYEGKTYHHIIDPRTGWPAEGTRSVTVVHTDATTADAAATAIFVAGPKEWHAVAERMGIRYVLLMDTEGVVHMNPAMAERVELLDRDTEVQISPPLTETRPKGT
jgi:thiamine biosynthesis lipoprotein